MYVDWLFPQPKPCAFCSRPAERGGKWPLCAECREEIGWIGEARCEQCGRHMEPFPEKVRVAHCPDCARFEGGVPVVNRAVVQYTPLAREVISLFKYRGRETLADVLGAMMADVVWREYESKEIDAVTYVPLHKRREEERGFNQAELLARVIGKKLRRPVVSTLVRTRDTPKQSRQPRQSRLMGMTGAFTLKSDLGHCGPLLIVDDVYTTGATLRACSRELLQGGCPQVLAVTFAR